MAGLATPSPTRYRSSMSGRLKGHVVGRRIVLDDPVDLPDGVEVEVVGYEVVDDDRAALAASMARGMAEAERGELIEADEVLAVLAQ